MNLSVIVPTLDEAPRLPVTLAAVRGGALGAVEVIVVDGGSSDGTHEVAEKWADRVVVTSPGRARQMNAGAAAARGSVLLFLHADTMLPAGYDREIEQAMREPRVVGGRFDVRIEPETPLLWLTQELMNLRSRWTKISTGDQAIFVRAETFRRLGGFPALPLMEDVAFSRLLKRAGAVARLRSRVVTSGRRWLQAGVLRTILLMWTLRVLFFLGVPAATLRRVYHDVR